MTIFRADVTALSSGPGPGGVPLPVAEADRVAAVLNEHSTGRPTCGRAEPAVVTPVLEDATQVGLRRGAEPQAGNTVPRDQLLAVMTRAGYPSEEIEAAAGALPDRVDLRNDHVLLSRFSLTSGELMDRMGSSP